ncbi:mitotic apparatus protein p62-like [Neltuma alba]|uniref:mitotic apparatus protein p62-like n=1 Tax=Neltuma alba TaxID=207710 RepID=UPI0010A4F598|nr:mitotic apparatus protein p62-like [Prosopis alba]
MGVEVEGEDGTKLVLGTSGNILFGRGSGFNTNDRTVSRRHISLQLRSSLEKSDAGGEPRVSFEVIGRNPIWVFSKNDGGIRIFRKFEKDEMEVGDRFCLSGKAPVWFDLKDSKVQEGKKKTVSNTEEEVSECSSNGLDMEDIDVSGIDPVKEFGFVVMGHEFDHYPKDKILNVKSWNWFLEEPNKDDEDEDDFEEKRPTIRRKRKKGKDNKDEDDDWTVESEEDTNLVASVRKVRRSGYSTRSKDQNKQTKDSEGGKSSGRKKAPSVDETVEDEEDETLGGFIVDDEEEDQEVENSEEEEEEELELEEDEVQD